MSPNEEILHDILTKNREIESLQKEINFLIEKNRTMPVHKDDIDYTQTPLKVIL